MNIMFLIFSFNIGGIERQMVDMAKVMLRRGHHLSICIINKDYTESILDDIPDGATVYRLNKMPGSKNFLPFMMRLSNIIRKEETQILHCQGINCVLFSSLARILNPHLRIVNTVHDQGNYSSYSDLKIQLSNLFLDKTIAISNAVRKEILTRQVKPEKVVTIYNAIDTNRFYYTTNEVHPISDETIEIGNVARFYPKKKGQDLLVRAVEKLIPVYPGIHCTFAGETADPQQNEYHDLQEYIQSHHLEEHFHFAGNINDIPAFLRTLDIFVLPSRYEGFGIALIEAMACGIPSIASRLAGPEEIINNNKLGILFAPGNVTELAEAIHRMILHYKDYNPVYISENARSRFSMEDMVEKHLSLYTQLLIRS